MSVSLSQTAFAGAASQKILPFVDDPAWGGTGISQDGGSVLARWSDVGSTASSSSSGALVTSSVSAAASTTSSVLILQRTSYVSNVAQTVSFSNLISIANTGSNPTYLIVSGFDRNEYTEGASTATGTLTGNGHSATFSTLSGDERTVGIVFTWNAATGQYTNTTYGNLLSLTYTTSGSANDLTDLTFFTTSNATLAASYANSPITEAINPSYWTDYGTVSFATQSVGTQVSTTQATPDGVASVALKFVGDAWNDNGCWVLASTIDAEAGAALSVASSAVGVAGVANGEWKVAYNGPVTSSSTWYSSLTTGDQVVFETTAGGGHITTVVSGSGMNALLVDNASNGANSANDGSSSDIIVLSPHAASAEFTGVDAALVVVYRLDTPTLTDTVSSESVASGKSFALSAAMSATDWYGTAISDYQVYDSSYTLTINGTACTTAHSASAAASCTTLSGISFLASGSSATSDTIYVRAENASGYWGDWVSLSVAVATVTDIPTVASAHADTSITAGLSYSITTASNFTDPASEKLTYSATLASGAALPSWMSLNTTTGVISGTAGKETAATAYSITVTATNTDGHSASETFTVTDALPPVPVFAGKSTASLVGGTKLSLSAAFTDPDKEALTYTAVLASGAALPSWLTVNASTGLLSGTAPTAKQTVQVEVTATDAGGASTTELVTITDTGTDVPKAKTVTTQGYTIYENHTVSISAAALFTDPSKETLSFLGTSLPSWLTLNATTGLLTGTAPASQGTFSFTVTATNTDGNSASESFTLTDVADHPVLAVQTAAQSWWGAQTGSLSLATNAFTDPLGEKLTYSATLASGAALPSWLTINASTGALTTVGTVPNTAQTLSISIKATNTDGYYATDTFSLSVKSATPGLTTQTGNLKIVDGNSVSVNLASTFKDPEGLKLTLSAVEISGTDASSWLHFNPATDMLTGVLPSSGSGVLSLQITATDTLGLSATETFGLAYGTATGSIPTISAASLSTALEHIVLHS